MTRQASGAELRTIVLPDVDEMTGFGTSVDCKRVLEATLWRHRLPSCAVFRRSLWIQTPDVAFLKSR